MGHAGTIIGTPVGGSAHGTRASSRRRSSEISMMVPTVEHGLLDLIFCSM
jgi:hypothetical protein